MGRLSVVAVNFRPVSSALFNDLTDAVEARSCGFPR